MDLACEVSWRSTTSDPLSSRRYVMLPGTMPTGALPVCLTLTAAAVSGGVCGASGSLIVSPHAATNSPANNSPSHGRALPVPLRVICAR